MVVQRPSMAVCTTPSPVESVDSPAEFCVLKFCKKYRYTIPSFSVITVSLRHVVVQGNNDDGELKVADIFFRDDDHLLEAQLPQCVRIHDACFVEVSYANSIVSLHCILDIVDYYSSYIHFLSYYVLGRGVC